MLSFFIALALAGAAAASQRTIVVGGAGGAITFTPQSVSDLRKGDTVVFEYQQLNHSIIQTSFDSPCVAPKENADNFFAAPFVRTSNTGNQTATTFTITIQDDKPIWFFCGQGNHCPRGMVGAINPPTSGERTLEKFIEAAAAVEVSAVSLPSPFKIRGGNLKQGDKADIVVPPVADDKPPVSNTDGLKTSTVVIQTSVPIVFIIEGATSTIATTSLSYDASKVTAPSEQVTYLKATVADGGSTSFSSVWATPTAGQALAVTSTFVASGTAASPSPTDGSDNAAQSLTRSAFLSGFAAIFLGVLAML